MKSKFLVLSSILMLALAGCTGDAPDFTPSEPDDGGQSGPVTPDTVSVISVSLDLETKTLEIGESFTLHESILPTNATNKNVRWSATGDGVVSVDNGVVRALKAGSSTVTVTTVDGNKTA